MNIQELGQKAKSLLNNLVKSSTGTYFNATQKISPAYFQLKDKIQKLNATPTAQFLSQPFPFRVAQGLGNVLQKVPEYRPFGKYTDTLAPALVHVPMLAKSYGSTLSRLADPKKLVTDYKAHPIASGFEDVGNLADFVPAMAVMGGLKVKGGNRIINTLESKLLNKDTKVLKNTVDEASVYVQKALDAKMPKGMTNRVAEVVDSFKKMGKDKDIMSGLMNESPAQTAFRRSRGIKPEDMYKGAIEATKTKFNQSKKFVAEMETELKNEVTIPVEKRVNMLDYLRTPQAVFEKLNLKDEGEAVSNAWTKYKMDLPNELNRITEWYKRTPDPKSSERIFDFLDGSLTADKLLPNEHSVALEMKDYLKSWAYKIGLPEDKHITNYISHIFPKGEVEMGFNPEVARLIDTKVPRSVYDRFLQKRKGTEPERYIHDAFLALDAYTKTAVRKLNMDPVLRKVEEASKNLDNESFKYVQGRLANVNLRPEHLDNLVDNFIKSSHIGYKFTARPVANISPKLRAMQYRGTLGLNLGSALRNTSQLANNYALLGEKKFAQGMIDLFTKGTKELVDNGVLVDNFIEDRNLNTTKQFLKKVDEGLYYMFSGAEKINRGNGYFGAKRQALEKGLSESEAIKYAVNFVKKTQFNFGPMDTPAILSGDIAKTLLQFQSFNLKNAEFLLNLAKDKNWGALARYTLSSILFAGTVGKLFGMDYKDIIPFSGVATGQTKIGQTPLIQAIGATGKIAFGDEDKRQQGITDLKRAGTAFFPAGVQIKKSLEGLNLVNKGYNPSASDRVRYSAPDSLGGKAQALLFGANSTANAQDYFDNNRSPLGEKQSEQFKALVQDGFAPSDAMKPFRDMQEKAKEKKQIEESLKSGKVTVDTTALQKYFELDQVANMTEDNLYSKAKKQQAIFSKISEILNDEIVTDDKKTEVLKSMGISRKYAEYYNTAKESPEIRTAYMMDKMSEVDSVDDLVKYRTSVNGRVLLTTEVLNNLVEAGVLDSGSANLLKNLTIKNGKVITPVRTGSSKKLPTFKAPKISMGRKITAPKLGRLKLRRFDSKGLRIPEVKIKPTQLKFSNESSTSNMYRLRV